MHHPKRRLRAPAEMQQRARELRRESTPAEQLLWRSLRGKRLDGLRFRRQHPIDRFIVDFFCAQHRLVIEVDGDVHAGEAQAAYDQARAAWLEERGYRVVRFTNRQTNQHLPDVLRAIYEASGGRRGRRSEAEAPPPQPSPVPKKEQGREKRARTPRGAFFPPPLQVFAAGEGPGVGALS